MADQTCNVVLPDRLYSEALITAPRSGRGAHVIVGRVSIANFQVEEAYDDMAAVLADVAHAAADALARNLPRIAEIRRQEQLGSLRRMLQPRVERVRAEGCAYIVSDDDVRRCLGSVPPDEAAKAILSQVGSGIAVERRGGEFLLTLEATGDAK